MKRRKLIAICIGGLILLVVLWVAFVFLRTQFTRDLVTAYEPYSFTHAVPGYMEARGVWAAEDGSYAHTSTNLICNEIDNACYESDAKFYEGTLLSDLTFYTIKSWDENQIVADNVALCATDEIIVDLKMKTVILTNTATDRTGICADFTSEYPTHAHLDSGMKVFYPSFQERNK